MGAGERMVGLVALESECICDDVPLAAEVW